jgi:hypothetical protein
VDKWFIADSASSSLVAPVPSQPWSSHESETFSAKESKYPAEWLRISSDTFATSNFLNERRWTFRFVVDSASKWLQ